MDLKLAGKRALVTGSTSGIGAQIAKTLAAEGVAVAINGRDETRAQAVIAAIRAAGGTAVSALGDVSSEQGAKSVVDAALAGLGGIDILVNNTGGSDRQQQGQDWLDPTPAVWLSTFERNVVSIVRLMHHLVPAMKERGWGRVIQIGSAVSGTPTAGQPDYGAAKAAMANLTVSASKGLSRTGITINTVSPGMTETPALREYFKRVGEAHGWGDDIERSKQYILDHHSPITVNRIGTVDDMASTVAFVASPLADFINGANLRVDGGASPSVN